MANTHYFFLPHFTASNPRAEELPLKKYSSPRATGGLPSWIVKNGILSFKLSPLWESILLVLEQSLGPIP